jgi:hypothetical protein
LAKFIDIELIANGMVLAVDAVNSIGQIVLPQGSELQDKHKDILSRFGISSVKVETEESTNDLENLEIMKLKILEEIDWKPRNSNEEDLIEAISIFRINHQNEANTKDHIRD